MKSITKAMVIAFVVLLAFAALASPAAARGVTIKDIVNGDTIYVGEEGLDFTSFGAAGVTRFAHYTDFQNGQGTPDKFIYINAPTRTGVEILDTDVGSSTGVWYGWDATGIVGAPGAWNTTTIQVPNVVFDVRIGGATSTDSASGKSVTRETQLTFRIQNNLGGLWNATPGASPTMTVELTTPGGGKQNLFTPEINKSVVTASIPNLQGWEAGTYSAQAKWPSTSVANGGTGFYNKGYNSNVVSFDVSSKSLGIVSNKDSVVRGNNFVVTLTGESKTLYRFTINNGGLPVPADQPGINASNFTIDANGRVTAGTIDTTAAGTRPLQIDTLQDTKDQTYTVEVKSWDNTKSDSVKVKVEKGQVTITSAGTGTYYIGEEITLSGTCTDGNAVYLYLVGQNLGNGNGVKLDDPKVSVESTIPFTNSVVGVNVDTDDTWERKWDTTSKGLNGFVLDSGSYTIYASSKPYAKNNLTNATYATTSISLRSPFLTATVSGASVAKGDDIKITGTAQGGPDNVFVWVFGKNLRKPFGEAVTVESDGSFEYTLDNTQSMASGQYYAIVQHPMMDGLQVPWPIPGTTTINTSSKAVGQGGSVVDLGVLQAPAAATALTDALMSQNTDDTYTKLTFMLEEPWILIDQITDKAAGSTFTISGTTNLAAGEDLLVTVTSASFKPSEKSQATQFTGASGTAKVVAGSTFNTWSFEVDASAFQPDQYIVNVESVDVGTIQTANFNVVAGQPTAVPTTPGTTPVPTTPAQTPTATATPSPTPAPGFGAVIALIGLGAVAFLVLRRN